MKDETQKQPRGVLMLALAHWGGMFRIVGRTSARHLRPMYRRYRGKVTPGAFGKRTQGLRFPIDPTPAWNVKARRAEARAAEA